MLILRPLLAASLLATLALSIACHPSRRSHERARPANVTLAQAPIESVRPAPPPAPPAETERVESVPARDPFEAPPSHHGRDPFAPPAELTR